MKTLDAAKIMDIAEKLISMLMLAYAALLFIRFIRSYMGVCIYYFTIYIQPLFKCAYARKRVVHRVAHQCKDALFPSPSGLIWSGADWN